MDAEDALQDGKNDIREIYSDDYDYDDSDQVLVIRQQANRMLLKNYTILNKDDIRRLQEYDITAIFSSALSISTDFARMILPYINGNFSNLTSYEDKKKYSSYLLRYYKRKIKWCPSPGCDFAIEFHYKSKSKSYDVTCSCSYTFCWNCTTEPHRPVDCETVSRWIMKNETVIYMKRMMNLKSLEEYTHYYILWTTQESLRQKAVADLKEVKELHLVRLFSLTFRFILKAWLQIVECRRVLKWSYVYGYYYMCEEEHKRWSFEYLQGEAEDGLERLHHCADKEFHAYLDSHDASKDDFNRFEDKLASLTCVERIRFENLVSALENGLFEEDTHGATSKGKGPTKGGGLTHMISQ